MKTFGLLITISLLVSCNHKYYAPNTANMPLLSEKGEARVNGQYTTGFSSGFNGGELQLAYAVSNHLGIMLNGFTGSKSEIVTDWGPFPGPDTKEKGYGSYFEVGSGYFKNLANNFVVEVYGGFGFGSVTNDYDQGSLSKVKLRKFSLQPAVALKHKHAEIGFVPRFALLNWRLQKLTGFPPEELMEIYRKPHPILFEPGVIVRTGFQNVKLQLSLNLADILNYSADSDLAEKLTLGIGTSIQFNTTKKKR